MRHNSFRSTNCESNRRRGIKKVRPLFSGSLFRCRLGRWPSPFLPGLPLTMSHLNRIQLRWSCAALALTCLFGFLSCEFVAKKLIVSAESNRLGLLEDPQLLVPETGVERYSVLTDGSLLGSENRSLGTLSQEETLRLIYRSQDGTAFLDGWVYVAEAATFGHRSASGWQVVRSDVSARLESAYLAVAALFGLVGVSFYSVILVLRRRLVGAVKSQIEALRNTLGLELREGLGEWSEEFAKLSSDLSQLHESRQSAFARMGSLAAIAENASEGISFATLRGGSSGRTMAF